MLCAGLVDSVSCNVVSVWRPCFVRVLSTVCRVILRLSGDHASCGSCRQCVMYCCVCLVTMLRAGIVNSVSCICCVCLVTMLCVGFVDSVLCNIVSVW